MIIKTKDGWKSLRGTINEEAVTAKPYVMETIRCETSQAAELLKKWEHLK